MTRLRRSLGLLDATALVVGCVIGIGIFRMAASVSRQLPHPGLFLLVWLTGGFISFCGALCYAELGAAFPHAGGDYVYLTRAYGPMTGFLFGWTKVFTERIGTIAVLGFVFAEYLSFIFPFPPAGIRWAATALILTLSALNAVGVHVGKRVQNTLTALKILALLLIIGTGILVGKTHVSFFPWDFEPALPALEWAKHFGVALVYVLWTYGGWTESSYVAEEIRNPERNLPWSILMGLGLVTGLYLLVNWVYLATIPLAEMPQKPFVAAEVMQKALGPVGGKVTALLVVSSACGALNGFILTSARILFAVGRDHPLFARMSHISPRFSTPVAALSFNAAFAVLLVWIGSFEQIVTYSTVAISVFSTMAALAVIFLRKREPAAPRPYRVWGYPFTPIFFVLAMILFIADVAYTQPKETVFGFLLLALGLPLYGWSRTMKK